MAKYLIYLINSKTRCDWQAWKALYKGPYIYDVHMEGAGDLEICHVFADSTVFRQIYCLFFWMGGGSQKCSLFVSVIST